jgi:hypothetical protein
MGTPCPRLRLGAFCWGQQIGSVAQRLAGLPVTIAVEIGVALAQQLLGAGIGADLLAAVRPRRKSQGLVMPPSCCQTP